MPYKDYKTPGVDVTIEQVSRPQIASRTEFLPVFIGTGLTSRSRTESLERLKANVADYPLMTFEYPALGNAQLFADTDFLVKDFRLHKEVVPGEPVTALVAGTDFEIVTAVANRTSSNTYRTTIKILDEEKITKADLYFDFKVELENSDYDFVPRLLTSGDRFQIESYLGPKMLVENGIEIRNDLAFAAEIAFRLNTQRFYYLEVPRDYGKLPTKVDFQRVIEEIFFTRDIYRIVPLTYDLDVIKLVSSFTTSVSNPNDKRQLIAFFAQDPAVVTDIRDMDSWVSGVGAFSESINNKRVFNVAGVTEIAMALDGRQYDLPVYFLAAAIAAYDTVNGMSQPISTAILNVFNRVKAPRFRPKEWGKLARYGVFVCYRDDAPGSNGVIVHHQLSTAQSELAEEQELSVVKNVDGTVVLLRDIFAPYVGKMNITPELITKLEATMALGIDEVINKARYMTRLTVESPWAIHSTPTGGGVVENRRTLVTRLSGDPAYPANNLDIILSI